VFDVVLLVGFLLLILFGGVALFGAPYLPTLRDNLATGLELLDLKQGQTMLELGSGDGRVLKQAAKSGIYAVGFELNPLLVLYSKISTFRQRDRVKVIWGSYWNKDWPEFDGVYAFVLQQYMSKLHKKVIQQANGKHVKVVSFGYEIKEKTHAKKQKGMFLYEY
jgi:16S rRNA A1518/A1519 N6-dimethyltransferase RsmA/KsgA/DIM1 with predicted DNA glycosylase/AP lyase activity